VSVPAPVWGLSNRACPHPAKAPPSGPGWLHEIKHDGFRILARRDGAGVRLITRAGNDFSSRFPFIAMAVSKLPVRSYLIDGEAIVCDENGLAVFDLIRRHGALANAVHVAFEALTRQAAQRIASVLNNYFEDDGAAVYRAACQLGCEGIVSKRLSTFYVFDHENAGARRPGLQLTQRTRGRPRQSCGGCAGDCGGGGPTCCASCASGGRVGACS